MPEQSMQYIDPKQGLEGKLKPKGNMRATKHLFAETDIEAINAAIACRRPLLLIGEPGTGKSQLARAAASRLGSAFIAFSVDSRTESRDLLWHFDALARLADAQLGNALNQQITDWRKALQIANYISPGPLWWGFNWTAAKLQAERVVNRLKTDSEEKMAQHIEPEQWDEGDPKKGCVVLIDEIDKAPTAVPNGLLEALGNGCFLPDGENQRVMIEAIPPLVVVTSNQERALPEAFLRRCLVHRLDLPSEPNALLQTLVARGKAHFAELSDELLHKAADMVVKDRQKALENHYHPLPGVAAYIDLLYGVCEQAKTPDERDKLLHKVRPYAVAKGFEPAL